MSKPKGERRQQDNANSSHQSKQNNSNNATRTRQVARVIGMRMMDNNATPLDRARYGTAMGALATASKNVSNTLKHDGIISKAKQNRVFHEVERIITIVEHMRLRLLKLKRELVDASVTEDEAHEHIEFFLELGESVEQRVQASRLPKSIKEVVAKAKQACMDFYSALYDGFSPFDEEVLIYIQPMVASIGDARRALFELIYPTGNNTANNAQSSAALPFRKAALFASKLVPTSERWGEHTLYAAGKDKYYYFEMGEMTEFQSNLNPRFSNNNI